MYTISVRKKEWLYLFCMAAIFEPDIFKMFPYTDRLFLVMKMAAAVIIIFQYINMLKRPHFSWLILLYGGVLSVSTLLNNQSLVFCFQKMIECIIAAMAVEIALYRFKERSIYLLFQYLSCLMLLEFLLCILFPNGILNSNSENYKMYFLGIKNGFIEWAILLFTCGLIVCYQKPGRKIKRQLLCQLMMISFCVLTVRSSTGIITWVLYLLCLFLGISRRHRFFCFYKVFPVLIFIYFGIVVFRIQEKFEVIFRMLFHKSASFTGRTITWDAAIEYIGKNPIWGYGIRRIEVIQTASGRGYSAHNFFLYVLLCGGIFTFIVIAAMIFMFVHNSYLYRNEVIQKVLTISLIAFFFATLTESGIYSAKWFVLFAMFGNLKIILNPTFSCSCTSNLAAVVRTSNLLCHADS